MARVMKFGDDDRFTCPPDVLARVIDGEAVLLNLESGIYFGLNEVGSCIWQRIVGGSTVRDMTRQVVEEFEVSEEVARRDIDALLEQLLDRGLARKEPT